MNIYLGETPRSKRVGYMVKLKGSYPYNHLVRRGSALEHLAYRRRVLELGRQSVSNAEVLWEMCRRDALFACNTFSWTYDPRNEKTPVIPFVLYPFQEECFDELISIWGLEDRLFEKSRDMGASWLLLTLFKYMADFRDNQSLLMMSRNESYVDEKGNMKALFQRVDFLQKYTPEFLKVRPIRRMMHYENPQTMGSIDGESTTGEAGSGDRRTALLVDELSKVAIPDQSKILASTRDVTRCRIFNYTAYGAGSPAHEMACAARTKKIFLHWSRHPKKNTFLYWHDGKELHYLDDTREKPDHYNWVKDGRLRSQEYDTEERRTLNSWEILQEWDCIYINSGSQFFGVELEEQKKKYCCDCVGRYLIDAGDVYKADFIPAKEGHFWTWFRLGKVCMPHKYVIGIDISTGAGASNSTATVMTEAGEQVAQYSNPNITPEHFAKCCVAIGNYFCAGDGSPALLVWEANGPGGVFANVVFYDLKYRHVWYRREEESTRRKYKEMLGWASGRNQKQLLLGEFRRALSAGECVIRDIHTITDSAGYRYVPGGGIEHSDAIACEDAAGAKANHGDRTMSAALAWWGAKGAPKTKKTGEKILDVNSLAYLWKLEEREDRLKEQQEKKRW